MTPTDVTVIGSGPCGAMAASELVRRGVGVTMLDAGLRPVRGVLLRAGDITIFRWSEDRMRYDRASISGDPMTTWGSCLSLGGLSNYWTAAVPRMSPDDFTEGARLDERFRWPITYEDLVPFYELVERRMSITAGEPIGGVPSSVLAYESAVHPEWADQVRHAADNGHAMGALPMAKGRRWMAALRPTAFTSYHQLIKPLLRSPHFRLIRGAAAVGIDASPSRDEASVEYITGDTHARGVIRSRAVVVAAGTIDSTRLLLRSRSNDFPYGLGNSSGILGRYLHDHPKEWWLARLGRPMPVLTHPLYVARQPVGVDAPLMASSLTLGLDRSLTRIKGWTGGKSDVIGVQVFGTMIPSEELAVRLVDDQPGGAAGAVADIAIRYDEQTLQNMQRARDRLAATFVAGGLDVQPVGPFHENRPGSSFHYGGTIRMHADRRFGVLDAWNRVYDASNVLVCDASCFTTGPEKNPTLTAMALSARAAHRLARDLGSGSGREFTLGESVGTVEQRP